MAHGVPGCRGLSSCIMSNQKHIVLAGGGTAGHVNPLLAVAHVIRELEPDADIAVVGTAVGLEHELVPQAGFELETIEKVPFPRRPNMAALKFPAQWKAETARLRGHPHRHEAQVVVGFGGYTSAPCMRLRTRWAFRLRCMSRTPVLAWPTSWAHAGRP